MTKKALVIGAALSGVAVSYWLKKQGYEVDLTDSHVVADKEKLEMDGIRVYDGGHPDFLKNNNYDRIVKNPGIPYSVPFVDFFVSNGCTIETEMDIALTDCPHHPYAAVTGTNGKTTTTTLLGLLLKTIDKQAVACGNIGLPVTAALAAITSQNCPLAIEVSAFQLVACQHFKPHVAVIMNLTPDHLNWFADEKAYYQAKTLIYRLQDENDYFLRNIDDENVMAYVHDVKAKVIDFSLTDSTVPLHIQKAAVWLNETKLFDLADLHLPGQHNIQNAMVAAAMAYLMGVKPQDIQQVIQKFKGVAHRIEYVDTVNGVRYYNDSKGTNVDATIVALKAFDCPVHLLVGGYDKKLPFDGLKPYLNHVCGMYAFGATKEQFKAIYPEVKLYDNMTEAFKAASSNATTGEVVLLSPACASWDQFPNFEVRGQQFSEMVKNLKH